MGRYGSDQFNRFLMLLGLVFFVISVFGVRGFYLGGLACLIYAYFRMLSRNTYKRSLENNRYLQYESKVKRYLSGWKRNLEQINVLPAGRRSVFPEEKEKLRSDVPNAARPLSKKADRRVSVCLDISSSIKGI
mgnify:CR=1 FL=1